MLIAGFSAGVLRGIIANEGMPGLIWFISWRWSASRAKSRLRHHTAKWLNALLAVTRMSSRELFTKKSWSGRSIPSVK